MAAPGRMPHTNACLNKPTTACSHQLLVDLFSSSEEECVASAHIGGTCPEVVFVGQCFVTLLILNVIEHKGVLRYGIEVFRNGINIFSKGRIRILNFLIVVDIVRVI